MSKTVVIIATAFLVIVLGIGIIAIGGGHNNNSEKDDSSTKQADLEYSYEIKEINAYQTSVGYVKTPSEGNIFVLVKENLVCNSSYFYLNSNSFVLNDSNVPYDCVYSKDSCYLTAGGTETMQQIFEIPASFSSLNVNCSETGNIKCTTAGNITALKKETLIEPSIAWDWEFVEDTTNINTLTTALSGNHFIVLKVIEKNVSYDGEYSPSLSHFKLNGTDNIQYGSSPSKSYIYSDDSKQLYNIILGKGASKTYHIVFEIPLTTEISSIIFDYSYAMFLSEQDKTLLS